MNRSPKHLLSLVAAAAGAIVVLILLRDDSSSSRSVASPEASLPEAPEPSAVEPDHNDAWYASTWSVRIPPEDIRVRIKEILDFELPAETENMRGTKPDPGVVFEEDIEQPDEIIAFTLPQTHRHAFLEAIWKRRGGREPVGRFLHRGAHYGLPFTTAGAEYWIVVTHDQYFSTKYIFYYDETNGSTYLLWFYGKKSEM